MKRVTPDDALSEIVGSKPLPRSELTKKLWGYIKRNKLQNQRDRQMWKPKNSRKRAAFAGKSVHESEPGLEAQARLYKKL